VVVATSNGDEGEVKESPAFFFEFWLMFIGSNYKKISFPLAKKIWAVQATHTRL
jgi:hypothetical protein